MLFSILFAASTVAVANVETASEIIESPKSAQELVSVPQEKIKPFTGKVTGSKVRLRLRPSLDGFILKEHCPGDLLIVTGEADDFYSVMPDKSVKGYLYRAYVLDNVVEANNVNLRLDPDIQSPIITQLSQGFQVNGNLCAKNNKWLEVELPADVRFYVAKEYVTEVGDVAFFHRAEARRDHAKIRLEEIQKEIAVELKKPFTEINLASQVNELKEIAEQNKDFPEYSGKAQELVKSTQDEFLQLSQSYQLTQKSLAQTKKEKDEQVAMADVSVPLPQESKVSSAKSLSYGLEQQESKLVAQAIEAGNASSSESFYAAEFGAADELSGQLIPYNRSVKNRPGDYMLVDVRTKVPLAYLYSNRVDLVPFVGKSIRLLVAKRPNNNYALPAYFVLEAKSI